MENKLLCIDTSEGLFLKDRTKTSEKKKRKNVRICSPSLALKKNSGALERYGYWSSQVPICVPAPCDPSL